MHGATKKTTAVLAGAVVLASAGYAIGSESGDGTAAARQSAGSTGAPTARLERRDHGLAALAQRLGVEESRLRTALDELRDELPRPERRGPEDLSEQLAAELGISAEKVESALRAQHPRRGERDAQHDAIADALARELGLEAAKVRAAIAKTHPRPGRRRLRRDPSAAEAALATELGVSAARLRQAFRAIRPAGPFGGDLSALAKAMGVETAKLEAAFAKLRERHEAEHARRRAAFAEALAEKLGIEQSKVEAALEQGGPFGRPFGGAGHHGPGGPGGPGRHGGP